jgi:very-short-patch-repair endonuclease
MSKPEELLAFQLDALKIPYEREYQFAKSIGRKWRADFAFHSSRLLVEIEGGIWVQGRHGRGAGMMKDMDKYNAATLLNWRLLRFSPSHVKSGLALKAIEEGLVK